MSDHSLEAELQELERTDPAVMAAAESYDRMVAKILASPTPHVCTTPELRAAVTARVDARLAWITANPACTCAPYDPECPEHGQVAS